MVKFRTCFNIFIALLIGGIIGAMVDRYFLFGPHRAVIDVSEFSSHLMESATVLDALKRNDSGCAKRFLESRVSVSLESADFYKSYAGSDNKLLEVLEKSTSYGRETLNAPILSASESQTKCR